MSRRSSLPGADELFRSTGEDEPASGPARGSAQQLLSASAPGRSERRGATPAGSTVSRPARRRVEPDAERRPTGRERHDEKITVYISPEELMDLERARLTLRGEHALAVDRGRIVREALAVVLADLEDKGEASIIVGRLRGL